MLIEMNVIVDKTDCYEQIINIQKEQESLKNEKALFEEHVLDWVTQLSLHNDTDGDAEPSSNDANTAPALSKNTDDEQQEEESLETLFLLCPISHERMEDPVLLMTPSRDTPPHLYDKKSICQSLLEYPMLEPVTGEVFDEKLWYVDSIHHLQLIMLKYGTFAYKKYDDSIFHIKYNIAWQNSWRGCNNHLPRRGVNVIIDNDRDLNNRSSTTSLEVAPSNDNCISTRSGSSQNQPPAAVVSQSTHPNAPPPSTSTTYRQIVYH